MKNVLWSTWGLAGSQPKARPAGHRQYGGGAGETLNAVFQHGVKQQKG